MLNTCLQVALKSLNLHVTILDFQKSPSSDFIWRARPLATSSLARGRPLRGQKRLAPLAKRSTCSKSSDNPCRVIAHWLLTRIPSFMGPSKMTAAAIFWLARSSLVFFLDQWAWLVPSSSSRDCCLDLLEVKMTTLTNLQCFACFFQTMWNCFSDITASKIQEMPLLPLVSRRKSLMTLLF